MRRQLVPGPVVRLTVIKAKTRPGIEATTVIDVITAPEKINSTYEWRIFRTQKIAFSPSWRLNYGGAYVQQLV